MLNNDNPDYISSSLRKYYNNWELLRNCYDELSDLEKKKKYLFRNSTEHDLDYERRLNIAVLSGRLNDAVNSYAALLNQWEFDEIIDPLIADLTYIDSEKNTIESFIQLANISALLHGASLIFVSPGPPVTLELLDLFDIRVPRFEAINGQRVLTRLGIKREITVPDGQFTEKTIHQWWVYDRGLLTVYQQNDKKQFFIVDGYPQEIRDASGQLVIEVPVIWYSVVPSKMLDFPIPPFLYLAFLSIKHFNKVSELDDIETKCNCPTWAKDWGFESIPENPPPLLVGRNNVIHNGENQKTYLIEPTGTAIESTHKRLLDLESEMDRVSRAFLNGGEVEKTATESLIESSQSQASLQGMAYQLELMSERLFSWVVRFSSPLWNEKEYYGKINVTVDIKGKPNPQEIREIMNGFTIGLYSRKYALIKLKEMGFQPEEIDLNDELNLESSQDTVIEDFNNVEFR